MECNHYGNDTILLINSVDWKKFSRSGCNLTAAIIKMDDDLRHRASAPLSSSSTHFPIILMYNTDEEKLVEKQEFRFGNVEVSIVFKNDDIKFKVPCVDNCLR